MSLTVPWMSPRRRSTSAAETFAAAPGRLRGLDGLRGVAVAAVVVFHLEEDLLPGGFLGVSLFFALSGFLLTTRVLDEVEHTGRIDVGAFWGRRVRRLLPAGVVVLLIVQATWWAAEWGDVSGDLVAAAAQVANWTAIVRGRSYGVDASASPLVHFWSLAVEEQFYWCFPLLVAAVQPTRRRLAFAFGSLLLVALVCTIWWSGDAVVVYHSTPTRAGEIALGVLAALAVRHSRIGHRSADIASSALLAIGLAAMAVLTLDDPSVSRGALLAWGAVFAAATSLVPRGRRVPNALEVGALRWLGHRAYGIYLFHWPLIVACDRLRLERPLAVLVVIVGTLLMAAVSYRLVELPIRRSGPLRRPVTVSLATAAAVVACAAMVPTRGDATEIDFGVAESLFQPVVSTSPQTGAEGTRDSTGTSASAGVRPRSRFIMIGDSKALVLAVSASHRVSTTTEYRGGWAAIGCPLVRAERVRNSEREGDGTALHDCNWTGKLAATVVGAGPIDVAVVYAGTWDTVELKASCCGDQWSSLDDAVVEQWMAGEIDAMANELLGAGVGRVALVTLRPADDALVPRRADVYNRLLREAAARRPDSVTVIDLAAWFDRRVDLDILLPDGVHTTIGEKPGAPDSGKIVFDEFLDAEISALTP